YLSIAMRTVCVLCRLLTGTKKPALCGLAEYSIYINRYEAMVIGRLSDQHSMQLNGQLLVPY
ncbi:hypothetical protein, partial [Salmonella enterica]|uniref:hypothetical protein n=1 Tax=Salmonella enterica TaxID=28901 RepID=UPI001ADD0359